MKTRPKILQYRWTAGSRLLICACLVLLCHVTRAQTGIPGNWRERSIAIRGNRIVLDTLSILPGTFSMPGIAPADYVLDPVTATLQWRRIPHRDSVHVRYRVLPLSFAKRYFHKDQRIIDSQIVFRYVPAPGDKGTSSFVDFNTVDYSGSYGRSISVGNNQDAALTSHFNLQAGGYLPDSIHLEAAISDNTLPFQPEGNTQRLQEFDQVYIRLTKKRQSLQLGDYTLDRPKGYFLNFTKRVQGMYYNSGFRLGKHADNSYGVSGSVAKGEFSRNIFFAREGNQGPYKLTSSNGELFFVVLAGTERVYINGVLQERGENADYTINYNTGELLFMPRRIITKDLRIQIEFEYQSRTYLNSLVYAWDELQTKKLNIRLNVYSNQDAKNQGYQQTLNGEQKRFLSGIGDSIGRVYYPVIGTDTFSANRILYKRIDTTVAGYKYDSVFIYSTNPDSAQYAVSFSFLGAGRGDYVISPKVTNGRVYDWVPPSGGHMQGDYAPVQLLITPKQLQVFTLITNYQIDSLSAFNVEVGASNYDPNLFSAIDNKSHWGVATRLRYNELRKFGKKDSLAIPTWRLLQEASYEFVQDRFHAIAPYRIVEFGRDWNIPQIETRRTDEHLAGYTTTLQHRLFGIGGYSFNYFGRNTNYTGYRNQVSYSYDRQRWRSILIMSLMKANDTFFRSQFFKQSALLEYRLPKMNHSFIGTFLQHGGNWITNAGDILRADAYRFRISSFYLRTPESQPLRYSLTYTDRADEFPRGKEFLLQSHSHTADARLGIAGLKNHFIAFSGSYRQLFVDDPLFTPQGSENSGLCRLEYTGNILRGAIQLQTLYETGEGQEQKRTYTYIEVPAGQGVYTWVDYNGNGVQEGDEFEIALYADQKKFIRILTPSNQYVRVNYVNFNQSISLEPSAYFGAAARQGWRKFLSRFMDQGSVQITNRLTNTGAAEAINPFIPALSDDRIIIASTSLSNTMFFNRNATTWGVDYTYNHNTTKQLLTYGVEGLANTQHIGRLRWNINSSFSTNIYGRTSLRSYESAVSDGRTYAVTSNSGEPSLTWMHRGVLRVTGTVRYDDRTNDALHGGEHAVIQRTDLELRYSKPVSGVLLLRGSYAGITYDGLTNSPVAFTMLDALQPGANFLWYANWDRRISKGIELSLEYEGRKPGVGTVVHTGRLTVRAIL